MQEFLISLGTQYAVFSYFIIIVLAVLEGPVLSMILGVLVRLDYFAFLPVYAALMAGDLLGDVVWYYIGRTYGMRFISKFGKYFSITEEQVVRAMEMFRQHHNKILFISKITNGLTLALAVLMTAGMTRVPFWRYFAINLGGQFIWTAILMGIGYFFGNLYVEIDNWLGRISIVTLFIVAVLLFLGYKKYLQQKAESALK